MLCVLAESHIVEGAFGERGQAECVVKLAISEQPGIGSDGRSMELKAQTTVKIDS
jgi:hypothetical protein